MSQEISALNRFPHPQNSFSVPFSHETENKVMSILLNKDNVFKKSFKRPFPFSTKTIPLKRTKKCADLSSLPSFQEHQNRSEERKNAVQELVDKCKVRNSFITGSNANAQKRHKAQIRQMRSKKIEVKKVEMLEKIELFLLTKIKDQCLIERLMNFLETDSQGNILKSLSELASEYNFLCISNLESSIKEEGFASIRERLKEIITDWKYLESRC